MCRDRQAYLHLIAQAFYSWKGQYAKFPKGTMPESRFPDRIHQCLTNKDPSWGSFKTLDIIIVMDTQID